MAEHSVTTTQGRPGSTVRIVARAPAPDHVVDRTVPAVLRPAPYDWRKWEPLLWLVSVLAAAWAGWWLRGMA